MLQINATLEHKPSDFCLSTCVVDKIVTIPQAEFEDFAKSPLRDRDFIAENIELMYCDENCLCHCLLVLGEDTTDGILRRIGGVRLREKSHLPPQYLTLYRAGDINYRG